MCHSCLIYSLSTISFYLTTRAIPSAFLFLLSVYVCSLVEQILLPLANGVVKVFFESCLSVYLQMGSHYIKGPAVDSHSTKPQNRPPLYKALYPASQTCSNLFRLDNTVQGFPPTHMFRFCHYVVPTVGKAGSWHPTEMILVQLSVSTLDTTSDGNSSKTPLFLFGQCLTPLLSFS